jgi:hypothetical protein
MNIRSMNTTRLTPANASQYIGHEIIFKSRNIHVIKRINSISETGKTIYIECPDLKNCLQIATRKVYVILE